MAPSKEDLKKKCRELGLTTGGNKVDLEKRLAGSKDKGAETGPQTPLPDAGSNDASNVQLSKGTALRTLLPSGTVHPVTAQCLQLLGDTRADLEDDEVNRDLGRDLEPVEQLVDAIVSCAAQIQPSSSHAQNQQELMQRLRVSLKDFDVSRAKTEVIALYKKLMPDSVGDKTPVVFQSASPLAKEVMRIQQGILTYVNRWASTFPQPLKGVWPSDFDLAEKKAIRDFVGVYVANHNLLEEEVTDDAIDATVKDIMLAKFPVPKGHNQAAVRCVVVDLRRTMMGPKKAAKKKAGADEVDQSESGGCKKIREGSA